MSLTDTCVAAVLVIQVFISTCDTHRSPYSPRFLCNTHNASVLPVAVLNARVVLPLKGLSSVFVIPSLEWWIISVKLLTITRNAFRMCRACRGFHTNVGCCKKTVGRTGCFHVPILRDQVRPGICFIRITSSRTHVSVSHTAPQNSDHL